MPPTAERDDRPAQRHGLHDRQRQRVLPQRRHRADVGAGDQRAGVASIAGQHDVVTGGQGVAEPLDLGELRPVAHVDQHRARRPRRPRSPSSRSKARAASARPSRARSGRRRRRPGAPDRAREPRGAGAPSRGSGGTGMPFQTRTTRSAGIRPLSTWRRATKSLTATTTSATISGSAGQRPTSTVPAHARRVDARARRVVVDDDAPDARAAAPRHSRASGPAGRSGRWRVTRLARRRRPWRRIELGRLQRGVELDGDGGRVGERARRIDDPRIGDERADAARRRAGARSRRRDLR